MYVLLCSFSEYRYFLFKGREECNHPLSPLDVANPQSAKRDVKTLVSLHGEIEHEIVREETHIRT